MFGEKKAWLVISMLQILDYIISVLQRPNIVMMIVDIVECESRLSFCECVYVCVCVCMHVPCHGCIQNPSGRLSLKPITVLVWRSTIPRLRQSAWTLWNASVEHTKGIKSCGSKAWFFFFTQCKHSSGDQIHIHSKQKQTRLVLHLRARNYLKKLKECDGVQYCMFLYVLYTCCEWKPSFGFHWAILTSLETCVHIFG